MEFYSKIRFRFYFLLAFVVSILNLKAQESNTYWQIDYAQGSIIKHRKTLGYLFTNRPEYLSIGWNKKAKTNSVWRERYNYPDSGLFLIYQNFNNKNLGSSTALNYTTTFYLRDRNVQNQFTIQLGFGFGYITHPFDFDANMSNVSTSTHVVTSQHLKLNYSRPRILGKFGLQGGLSFTHFSNGSFKKPNLGINSIFFNIGLNYHNAESMPLYKKSAEKEEFLKQPIHFSMSLNAGIHETKPGMGTKAVYFANGYVHKRVARKSNLQVGVDFYNSQSAKDNARYRSIIEGKTEPKDHKQIGVFVGHELFFNKLSLETQVGYYIYRPLVFHPRIYQKTSFKYFFNNRKSALGINLKFHNFEAEFISLGLHHQLF